MNTNEIKKEASTVPTWKKYIAFCIDLFIYLSLYALSYSFSVYFLSVEASQVNGVIFLLVIYILYFCLSLFKYQTTIGLYLFNIKIEFENKNILFIKIFMRGILSITVLTGIGFIIYLFIGPYWDKITGAHVVWRKIK